MAGLPLNNFRTITRLANLETDPPGDLIAYKAPLGFKSVFLLAQVTNIGSENQNVSFKFLESKFLNTVNDGPNLSKVVEIVSNFEIPPNDTLNLLTGKLVLETMDSIIITGTSNTDLKFIASVLETSA